ncbi:glycosyltransferase [Actinomadura sp. J1-007]|nr:glycosyltransferase [Actinomadura sp. J1-007]
MRRGGRAPARGPGRRPGALQGRPQRRGPAAVRPGGRGRTARGPRRPGPASGRAPRGLPRPRHAAEGQDVLLAAWPSVRARCPDALLALVGEDATAALADPAAAGRGEAGQVSVQGGLRLVPPVEDPRRWLAAADVVVMPSRWEGLPLTALEALATGRPLVGSAVPGLVEAAGPGTGALVPPEDVPALAAAVAARLLDPALAAAEGRAGTAWVEDFDADGTFALLAGVTWGLVGGDGVAGVGAWPGPGPGPAADGADPVAVLDGEGAGPV